MSKHDTVIGEVIEALPQAQFRVQIAGEKYICYLAGKIKQNRIQIVIGDIVEVVLDPAGGKTTNRIVWRK